MAKNWMVIGCILAGLGVAAGAFGTHALQGAVPDDLLVVYATAARYQMIHAAALLFVGLADGRWPDHRWDIAGWLFTSGTIVFSGSLYLLALTGSRWLGAITPIGGACFLAGWVVAALAANRTATMPDEVDTRDGAA
jgi:uncharacterized membrane protein YgdD (TMEM256/DUF423 family)